LKRFSATKTSFPRFKKNALTRRL